MTQEELLFTFCPPAPPERTNDSSMSLCRTPSVIIRCSSCASLSAEGRNELMSQARRFTGRLQSGPSAAPLPFCKLPPRDEGIAFDVKPQLPIRPMSGVVHTAAGPFDDRQRLGLERRGNVAIVA